MVQCLCWGARLQGSAGPIVEERCDLVEVGLGVLAEVGALGEVLTQQAARFLDALGYDTVDAGPLAESWRWQPGTPAHLVYAGDTIQVAAPADADKVRAALAAATR